MSSSVRVRSGRLLAAALLLAALGGKASAAVATCFAPGEDCAVKLVQAIDTANSEVLVQSSAARLPTLVDALGRARDRGVGVTILLARIPEGTPDAGLAGLAGKGAVIAVDDQPTPSTGNTLLIDRSELVVASYAIGRAGREKNVGYLLFVTGEPDTASAFLAYWQQRAATAHPLGH